MNAGSRHSMSDVLNVDELLARCLGNIDFAARVLATFQDRFGQDLEQLEKGLREQDTPTIAQVAHRIKGSTANVSAPGLHETATQIEQLGRQNRIADVSSSIEQLRCEWTRFVEGVSSLELASCNSSGSGTP